MTSQLFLEKLLLYWYTGKSTKIYYRSGNLLSKRTRKGPGPQYTTIHNRKWPYLGSNLFLRSSIQSFALLDRFRAIWSETTIPYRKICTSQRQMWKVVYKACLNRAILLISELAKLDVSIFQVTKISLDNQILKLWNKWTCWNVNGPYKKSCKRFLFSRLVESPILSI